MTDRLTNSVTVWSYGYRPQDGLSDINRDLWAANHSKSYSQSDCHK